MPQKYYLDTCIWRDFYENRFSKTKKSLGDEAAKLFMNIIKKKDIILYSEVVIKELSIDYNKEEVISFFNFLFLSGTLKMVDFDEHDYSKAKKLAQERNIPVPDVLHAIIARNCNSTIISQDRHFQKLKDIVRVKKPEEV